MYSECSLDCGNDGGRCLQTKIPDMPEICACPDGIYSNSSCVEVEDGNENESNITSMNIHGLLLNCSIEMISTFFVLSSSFNCCL